MNFFKQPFQKQYIPVLVALLAGVACTAVDHGIHRLVPAFVWLYLATAGVLGAGKPLKTWPFWLCVMMSALWISMAVLMVFVGAFLAAGFAALIGAYPTALLLTRPREEKTDVQ